MTKNTSANNITWKSIEETQLKIIREALRIRYKKDSKLVIEYANCVKILHHEDPDKSFKRYCNSYRQVELYVDRDKSFDPKNTLNGITTVHIHMQRVANEALHYQGLLNIINEQVNNLINDMPNIRNEYVEAFNPAIKTNVLSSKIAERFVSPNPFNNTGANQTSLKTLNHKKFNISDLPETYEKRIKPCASRLKCILSEFAITLAKMW
ncbi:6365_t:CDS:2 [Funneliformis geosporum]|nr:6365_t:CDS:2 [Funneliformis geosporum]